ncbi:hypothetical protein QOZ88_15050 [Blastococcus sp. BMG 814]|uniref:Lipoprotein n=1 Tax=Blastococcus carthaginiensis TaxID=3050034 RepID=A0ABT9IFN8_9ACTN|nr:hypothetical protein [Blastococcus carthaginiensis]MDP5183954.1 hypothetical protein [Blastococcus carthaginiensis]
MRGFRARYGAHPLHLLALLVSLAVAGYAALKLFPANPIGIAVWLVGSAVVHDFVLLPLYTVVDRGLIRAWRRWRGPATELPRAPWINFVRVPSAVSGLLLVFFFPLIFRLSPNYTGITGMPIEPYLDRWLLVTAALFGLSALCYAVRLRRAPAPHRPQAAGPNAPGS